MCGGLWGSRGVKLLRMGWSYRKRCLRLDELNWLLFLIMWFRTGIILEDHNWYPLDQFVS